MNYENIISNTNQGPTPKRTIYISVKAKFIIAITFSILWALFSIYLSKDWIKDLASVTNLFIALFIITGIAYIPGFINAFLLASILLDKQPKFKNDDPMDEVTILIAAYNEENGIYNTLSKIKEQDYKGKINNSSDNTVNEVYRAAKELNLKNVKCIDEPNPGKFNALNKGLKLANTEYVITLDADTLLHSKAIRYLVSRINSAQILQLLQVVF